MNDPSTANLPTNGQAFWAYLRSALAVLEPLTPLDYYQQPLPSATDEALAEVVHVFTAWSEPDRRRFLDSLPVEKRTLFGIFGHRAATLSVRQLQPEWLSWGLIANTIANKDAQLEPDDGRGLDVALAVFYHCARTLKLKPESLFDEATAFTSDDLAAHLRAFGRREDVTLKQFGWREIRRPEGVSFKFEW
jgi:hypothetical protein